MAGERAWCGGAFPAALRDSLTERKPARLIYKGLANNVLLERPG